MQEINRSTQNLQHRPTYNVLHPIQAHEKARKRAFASTRSLLWNSLQKFSLKFYLESLLVLVFKSSFQRCVPKKEVDVGHKKWVDDRRLQGHKCK